MSVRLAAIEWVRSGLGLGLTIALLLFASCRKTPPPPPPATASLAVEIVGCAAVKKTAAGTTCELPESRSIRAVLPRGATNVSISTATTTSIDAGTTPRGGGGAGKDKDEAPILSIVVPANASKLEIGATINGAAAHASIPVATLEPRAWLDEARTARGIGELDRATSLASAHARDGDDATARALAKGLLARIALSRGRADEAFPLFREAIDLHRAAGRVSDAADDSFALAFALHQRSQRYTEARAVLDAVTPDIALYPEGRAREPYYRGVLAAETGDRRRALALLREAEGHARRLGMTRLERNARSALALEMQEIGRARASLPLLAALEGELDAAAAANTKGDAPSACERVEVANNRGWGALLVNEAAVAQGEPSTEDARSPLERALAITGCSDAYVRGFALANLARLALGEADLKTAERRLAEAKAGVKEPRGTERIAWMELEGRLALAHGRDRLPEALRVLDEALSLARASVLRLQEWSLLVSRGEALEALGRTRDAIESLKQAEDVLDDATLLVPLGEGRGAFVGGRSSSARALVGLLVKTKQIREAANAGRRAQVRVLSSVERALRLEQLAPVERAQWEEAVRAFRTARAAIDSDAAGDWKLPADALKRAADARAERERELRAALENAMAVLERTADPKARTADAAPASERKRSAATTTTNVNAIAPGVIEIDVYPDRQGFVALVMIEGRDASSHRVPSPRGTSDEDLAHALFDPIRPSIEAATTLRIRAYGAWRTVDVHALPWRAGEPLLQHVAVDYALGLATPSSSRPATTSKLVVGDPSSDLPGALAEAREVAGALEKQSAGKGSSKVQLLVRDEATSRAVTDALRSAPEHFHYAGHGIFAGEEGWESALPLASGGRLTVGDVLALAPAPSTVILTGCEAAKNSGEAEGLGLAQAFLVAGSSDVLAPTRRVPDALASKIATALYKRGGPSRDVDGEGGASQHVPLALRARDAILSLRAEDPSTDWAAFRVLVP